MGLRASEDSDYFEHVQVALLSARHNAPSLVPYLVYSGAANAMTAWFELHGGEVLFHDLSFFNHLRKDLKTHESGPFLRLDVPSLVLHLEVRDDIDAAFALYTDVDVLFMQDINSCTLEAPEIFALGGEFAMGEKANSGVMYMNVPEFGAKVADLIAFGERHDWDFPAYDQGLLLAFFRPDQIAQLPDQFNWKGYWGKPEENEISILHWHGPKPRRNLHCLLNQLLFRNSTSSKDAAKSCGMDVGHPYVSLVWDTPDHGTFYNEVLQVFEWYSLQIGVRKDDVKG